MEPSRPKQPIPNHAKKVFHGVIFDIYQWEQKMYDGTTKIFEKARRPSSAVVFPVLENGNILMIEQEQPGRGVYTSLPGGRLDEGENILDAAKRELLEETGYESQNLVLWKTIYPSIKVEYATHYFIAKNCKKTRDQVLDGGEKINLKEFSFEHFLQFMRKNQAAEKEVIAEIYEALLDKGRYNQLKEMFLK